VRKAIVSIGAGPQTKLLRLARTSFEPYARRHGYDLHLMTEIVDGSRPAPWSKVRALQDLQERYDLLLWLDADLIVVDGRTDIADELEDDRFLYLVEHRIGASQMPNSGVMLLRTGEHCAAFLEWIWAQEDLVDHIWWENAAICRALGYDLDPPRPARPSDWLQRTKLLSGRWNSIPDARAERPRVRHYPGYSLKTRAAFMARDACAAWTRRRIGRG
jgi:hypothetical protein